MAFTEYAGHGQEIAQQWAQQQQDKKLLVVVGGDGTIHEVVNGVVHNEYILIGVVRVALVMILHVIFTPFPMPGKSRIM